MGPAADRTAEDGPAPGKNDHYNGLAMRVLGGRYQALFVLGAGGMAEVWLAHDKKTGREVALKRVHSGWARSAKDAPALVDEARLLGRIRHPNVVELVDVLWAEGELVLVMEYVRGLSLAQLLANGRERDLPPPPEVACAIVVGALRGLEAAHTATDTEGNSLGLIHRDVTPENILVGADGVAKLTDFGIARAEHRSQRTKTGDLKGKVRYLAPEQIHGQAVRETDLFAMGVTLWEALTGKPLSNAATDGEALAALLMFRATAPSAVREGISPALDEVVLRSLAAEPEARYRSASDMASALELAMGLTPAATTATAAWVSAVGGEELAMRDEKAKRPASRRGLWGAAGGALVALALVVSSQARPRAGAPGVNAIEVIPSSAITAAVPSTQGSAAALVASTPPVLSSVTTAPSSSSRGLAGGVRKPPRVVGVDASAGEPDRVHLELRK